MVNKLQASLEICREYMVLYEWKSLMKTIDHVMSNTSLHCLIRTDFRATVDLSAAEKENSSVDNHAVVCIFFVTQN